MSDWLKWKEEELKKKEILSWQERFKAAASDKTAWHELYLEYRKSNIFRDYARKVIKRANGFCEGCSNKDSFLKVIHKTYIRIGGSELLEDSVALCLDCRSITEKIEERVNLQRGTSKDYQTRIVGLATKHYGAEWRNKISFEMIEKSYVSTLYKRYCDKNNLSYNSVNPEMDLQYWIFWEDLIKGFPDLKPVKS